MFNPRSVRRLVSRPVVPPFWPGLIGFPSSPVNARPGKVAKVFNCAHTRKLPVVGYAGLPVFPLKSYCTLCFRFGPSNGTRSGICPSCYFRTVRSR